MKQRTIRLNSNEPTLREQFLEIDAKVSNNELLNIEDLYIFSNISYYDIQNEFDIISKGGVLDEYCQCSRFIAQDIESLKYDKTIFENIDRVKLILNNLKRAIQLKDIKSENECLTSKETCIFHADKNVFDEIADEMQLLVNVLNRYSDIKDSKPFKKIDVQISLLDFISEKVKDKEAFLNGLKENFKIERGRSIKTLIVCLESYEAIAIPNRQMKTFVELLRNYLGRDIGTYQSINDQRDIVQEDKNPIEIKLKPIIQVYID